MTLSSPSLSSPHAHVLLVDDNIDGLQLLLNALRGANYRISVAFDAIQGYRRATALQPDLILLDVRMGDMDGFTTCRLLKADPVTASIPVIFVTASDSLEERLTGLRGGAVDYVLKPFEPEEVLARVAIHVALRRTRLAHDAACASAQLPMQSVAATLQLPARLEGDKSDPVLVRAAMQFLTSNLSRLPGLAEIAAQVGTHEKRLSKAFRAQTGQSVFAFVREARLGQARQQLVQTALSIEEVAAEAGFSSAANFATAFRERFGATPSACRGAGLLPDAELQVS
jgi:DNA-binding response OmpR family regulator